MTILPVPLVQQLEVNLRRYEKATKLKNIPTVLTKQLFLLSNVKTCESLFQIFIAVSEKLNFTKIIKRASRNWAFFL